MSTYSNKGAFGPTITVARDGSGMFSCDGTADDVQINAALADLATLGGGVLYIKKGTYDVTATLTVASDNIQIQGEGRATILTLGTGANVDVITIGGIFWTIRDLEIDGNDGNQGAGPYYGIFGSAKNNTFIHNIYFYACDYAGIRIAGGSERWRIASCTFIGNARRSISSSGANGYIAVQNCMFKDNSTDGTSDPDIEIYNAGHDWTISNCSFYGSGYSSVLITGEGTSPCYNITVTGCTIEHTIDGGGLRAQYDCYDISFVGNVLRDITHYGFLIKQCNHVTISGNTIEDTNQWGIGLEGYDGNPCYNITIKDNTLLNCSRIDWKGGIILTGVYGDIYNVIIEGNIIYDDESNDQCETGIDIKNGAYQVVIKNNIIDGMTNYGIYIRASGGGDDCMIGGNLFLNTPTGVHIDDGDDIMFTGNRLLGLTTGLDIANANCVSIWVDSNNFEGCATDVNGGGVATTPMYGNNIQQNGTVVRDGEP